MAKIKLTKNELKKQKDALTRFQRYLPTLILKKQQLQMEIRRIDHKLLDVQKGYDEAAAAIGSWVKLFCDDVDITALLEIDEILMEMGNIAGIDIPIFKGITVSEKPYDLFHTPLWVDQGLAILKKQLEFVAELKVLKIQKKLLGDELRVTSQRVNLFEKVKIVEAKEHIRVIKIFLGDQQTAAVVRGKISKKKIEKVS